MAKAVLKKVEDGAAAPTGRVLRAGESTALDAASVRLLLEGWALKGQIEALEAQLRAVNERLIEAHGAGATLIATGVCRATITARESVSIEDAERLKGVLGFRFSDLVRTQVSYKPEGRLLEMAADGDEPLAPAIRACLKVGESVSVTWRAER
ncbi:MAG: hypothetical protein RMK90_14865 [Acetobacteraceae bacterium]|nr:hypothetical protein [Acetobacteraceae bacterium]